MNNLVGCETTAAISVHLRENVNGQIRLGGHSGDVKTLCGKRAAWDVRHADATCRDCLDAAAKMKTEAQR